MTDATFHKQTELEPTEPTLIEGLPGTGMVASIAVDQITDQLGLDRHGAIRSDAFPPVASFTDGRIQDTVRVYLGDNPDVMTLQSDVPIPQDGFSALSGCVLEDLTEQYKRAIFLAGAPAQSEEQRGDVIGVATTDSLKQELVSANIDVKEESGAVGGVTGKLVTACYHADIPAVLLLVRTDPRLPDPKAAHSVIEDALEPLVKFDIDTDELLDQAEGIQQQKRQIAQQLQEQSQQGETPQSQSMFQ
ncbi:proteasome assembly chaperone family protein [Haloarcula nitratireducens]|uniref:PAC2 family protein n=1 Tax=Haloarcula nitratireducens TaxID=2487749 RepID=A0AAW4PFU8_9EURY|nr:PAC2 family protein [Halomicroarcula nitratireducens]MBX0296738.1 PAC2 family protein [Halomicroarcula nitratireducens]